MPEAADVENEAKQLQRDLEGWREVLLHAYSLLTWERPADPGFLFGGTTLIFLLFWYLDPSVITTMSLICLILAVVDYLVPTLSAQMIGKDYWTGSKEKKLEKICKELAVKKLSFTSHARCYINMRNDQPKKLGYVQTGTIITIDTVGLNVIVYFWHTSKFLLTVSSSFTLVILCFCRKFYLITVISLAFLSWIGNAVGNLLLTYITVTVILMTPGMNKRGWLTPVRKAIGMVCCSSKVATKKLD